MFNNRRAVPFRLSLKERLQARLGAAQDQGVDVMRAFIGVHGFPGLPRGRMTWNSSTDAVATMHVAGVSRDLKRFAAVVALDQADHLGRGTGFVHQAPYAQTRLVDQARSRSACWQVSTGTTGFVPKAARIACDPSRMVGSVPAGFGRPHGAQAIPYRRAGSGSRTDLEALDIR